MALADLQAALANIQVQLNNMTVNPKTSYSVAGRNYTWDEHFASLTARHEEIERLIQRQDGSGGAFEIRSWGYG